MRCSMWKGQSQETRPRRPTPRRERKRQPHGGMAGQPAHASCGAGIQDRQGGSSRRPSCVGVDGRADLQARGLRASGCPLVGHRGKGASRTGASAIDPPEPSQAGTARTSPWHARHRFPLRVTSRGGKPTKRNGPTCGKRDLGSWWLKRCCSRGAAGACCGPARHGDGGGMGARVCHVFVRRRPAASSQVSSILCQ